MDTPALEKKLIIILYQPKPLLRLMRSNGWCVVLPIHPSGLSHSIHRRPAGLKYDHFFLAAQGGPAAIPASTAGHQQQRLGLCTSRAGPSLQIPQEAKRSSSSVPPDQPIGGGRPPNRTRYLAHIYIYIFVWLFH
eukprot:gene11294-7827_t